MGKKGTIAILTVNILLCIAAILLTYFFMGSWGVFVRVVFYAVSGAGIAVSAVTFIFKKIPILKTAFILIIVAIVFLAAFIAISELGHLNDYETDEEKINALIGIINGTGAWGMLVFFLLQVLQIVILPLPAVVCYVPGAQIWGPLVATLLASAGVLVGSVIAYFIGRIWGKKAVIWIAGKETTEKYSAIFGKKGKVIFVLMQILPFFPDDILCMVAGLTSMNFLFFFVSILIVRPVIIAVYCYLGSGDVIPFEGWGIAVWVTIFAVCIALAVLSFKYQDRFEKWLITKFSKKGKTATVNSEEIVSQVAEANTVQAEDCLPDIKEQEAEDSGGNTASDEKPSEPPSEE